MMKPTATACMDTSGEMPKREQAMGTSSREPPATPEAPHAPRVATKLKKRAERKEKTEKREKAKGGN